MAKEENKDDLSVLEYLYVKYKNLMFREALYIVHDENDAEDIVQQACLKLIPYVKNIKYKEEGMTCNFIKVVVRNIARDSFRKSLYLNKKEDVFDHVSESDSDFYAGVTDSIIERENVKLIDEAINKLPDKYREIILLEKIYCYPREETMKMLGLSYEAAKKRMTRAKSMLLEILKKEGLNDGREKLR